MVSGDTLRAVRIEDELKPLVFLENRTPHTSPAMEGKAFARLAEYREGAVFAGGFSGESAWERHPEGDELIQILDGSVTLTVMRTTGPESHQLERGMIFVVPRGCWHKFNSRHGVTLMTVTPQPTEHSTLQDLRETENES